MNWLARLICKWRGHRWSKPRMGLKRCRLCDEAREVKQRNRKGAA